MDDLCRHGTLIGRCDACKRAHEALREFDGRGPDDRRCPICGIPLRAIVSVTYGRCTDVEACAARSEVKGYALLEPEGVTRIRP